MAQEILLRPHEEAYIKDFEVFDHTYRPFASICIKKRERFLM